MRRSSSSKSFSSSRIASRVCVWNYKRSNQFMADMNFTFKALWVLGEHCSEIRGYLFHRWFGISGWRREKRGEFVSGQGLHPQLFPDFTKTKPREKDCFTLICLHFFLTGKACLISMSACVYLWGLLGLLHVVVEWVIFSLCFWKSICGKVVLHTARGCCDHLTLHDS